MIADIQNVSQFKNVCKEYYGNIDTPRFLNVIQKLIFESHLYGSNLDVHQQMNG